MSVAEGTSPAKLILSGEYSIATGQPALALPVPLMTHARIELEETGSPLILLSAENFAAEKTFTWAEFETFCAQKHEKWRLQPQSVLETPTDLMALTLWQFHQLAPLPQGRYRVSVRSHNLIGRGLGSSAAVVVSLIRALEQLVELPLADDARLALAIRCEHYAHGRSSGLDPLVILRNAPLQVQRTPTGLDEEILDVSLPPFHLIDTGAPESRTGECVMQVRTRFPADHPIWPAFGETTRTLRQALEQRDHDTLREAIQTNHILLRKIGVVPDRVAELIRSLNETGAAKLSGAGSIRGEAGGMVIHFGPAPELAPPFTLVRY